MGAMAKTVLGSIVGAVCGALSGAALLGVPTYFSNEAGFIGSDRAWASYLAIWGFILGLAPGAVIGFLVGTLAAKKILAGLIGGGVGLIIFLSFFAPGLDSVLDLHNEYLYLGVACIPIFGVIGLVVSVITNRRDSKTPPNVLRIRVAR